MISKNMGPEPSGLIIVTLRANSDVEATKKRVLKISGVTGVEYSYLTHKLRVGYQGDHDRVGQIDSEIRKIVKGKSGRGR